jgi:4-hydroxybenzoate polyprenyltransferase
MTALQCSIGALNDLVDRESDRIAKAGKPIPSGSVSPTVARMMVVVGAAIGLGLAVVVDGPPLVALAIAGLMIGYGYDLVAKGTPLSWLPFAVGIPLLPVYGWFGATGGLASWFVALLPMSVLAGGAVAIANASADLERDEASGTASVATSLGIDRSWWLLAGLWVTTGALAIWSMVALGDPEALVARVLVVVGLIVVLAGTAAGRHGGPVRRERAWEAQAVGAAITGVAWLLAVA